jgi:hypothetical protein
MRREPKCGQNLSPVLAKVAAIAGDEDQLLGHHTQFRRSSSHVKAR